MEMHKSVLLEEAINYLNVKSDGLYIDMTLGYAGHSKEILKRNKNGFLFAFDKDIDAIKYSTKKLEEVGSNFKIFNEGFINVKEYVLEKVDGILFDLGISSPEIDEGQRGFSYMKDAYLDMRMQKDSTLTAYDVINKYEEQDLIRIFREYGEEKYAGKITKRICEARNIKNIETTLELVNIIDKCIPYREKRDSHPAKKVFQAIRIEVNNELGEFTKALYDSLDLLKVGGVIVVITFHSLEDRICKKVFKEVSEVDPFIKGMPNVDSSLLPNYELVTAKPILPSAEEIERNCRAKSAKMRVIKKIK